MINLRGLLGGVNTRVVSTQCGREYLDTLRTLDLAERFIRFQEAGRGPARSVWVLDHVGGAEAAHERRCELQTIDGERLLI